MASAYQSFTLRATALDPAALLAALRALDGTAVVLHVVGGSPW